MTVTMTRRRGPRPDPAREAFWRSAVARQRDSGMGVRAWCRRERLGEASFYAWRSRLRRRDAGARGAGAGFPTGFVELLATTPPPSLAPPDAGPAPVELVLPAGGRVLVRGGCDRRLLAEVLAALAAGAEGEGEGVTPCCR